MLGFFGDIIFETSDQRILTFSNFQRSATAEYAKHRAIGKKPASEFIGPDLDTISFTVNLNGNFGVKPKEEMDRWLEKCRNGNAEVLVIGDTPLGMDKWVVKSVSQIWNVVFKNGELFSGNIEVELEEYLEEL